MTYGDTVHTTLAGVDGSSRIFTRISTPQTGWSDWQPIQKGPYTIDEPCLPKTRPFERVGARKAYRLLRLIIPALCALHIMRSVMTPRTEAGHGMDTFISRRTKRLNLA